MGLLVPVILIALGLASQLLIEVSAELSTDVLLESNAGIDFAAPQVAPGELVDLRPEASLNAPAEPRLSQPGS